MQQESLAYKKSFYFDFLKSEFSRRQNKNSRYSLRSYARHLGLHPSTLSSVLLGKRLLSVKDAYKISEKVNLTPREKKEFFASLIQEKKKFPKELSRELFDAQNILSEESSFDIISEWEHYVMLYLVTLDDFEANFDWMGNRLGISPSRAEKVFKRLIGAGMLKIKDDSSVECVKNYNTTTDGLTSKAIRIAHKDSLTAAAKSLELPVQIRDITSLITTIDPADLPKLQKEIRRFHSRIEKIASKCLNKEVYEMVIALFPRTQK